MIVFNAFAAGACFNSALDALAKSNASSATAMFGLMALNLLFAIANAPRAPAQIERKDAK